MEGLDIVALLKLHYTQSDPPVTRDTEPDAETARKAKRWVIRERDVRELLALAATEAVTRANEATTSRYPAGSMHCREAIGLGSHCADWLREFTPRAEKEVEKFENVVPMFDELEAYAGRSS